MICGCGVIQLSRSGTGIRRLTHCLPSHPPAVSSPCLLMLKLSPLKNWGLILKKADWKSVACFIPTFVRVSVDWKEELFDDDRLYSAILRSLEQTHCARMWFYMSDYLFIAHFRMSTEVVYLQHWHGWCHMKLQPSRRKFCVHHTTMLHVTSCKAAYVRCMRV